MSRQIGVQSEHNFLCSLRGVTCNQERTGRDGAIVSCWSWVHPGSVWALIKMGMSRWDSLPASSPVTWEREPICQEKHWVKLPCGTAMPGDSHLQTASHQSDATTLYWQANYSLQHSNASWWIHLHPSALSLCYLVWFSSFRGKGRWKRRGDPSLVWQRRLWRGWVSYIKTDGVASLSNWMADHIFSAALWKLILSVS